MLAQPDGDIDRAYTPSNRLATPPKKKRITLSSLGKALRKRKGKSKSMVDLTQIDSNQQKNGLLQSNGHIIDNRPRSLIITEEIDTTDGGSLTEDSEAEAYASRSPGNDSVDSDSKRSQLSSDSRRSQRSMDNDSYVERRSHVSARNDSAGDRRSQLSMEQESSPASVVVVDHDMEGDENDGPFIKELPPDATVSSLYSRCLGLLVPVDWSLDGLFDPRYGDPLK